METPLGGRLGLREEEGEGGESGESGGSGESWTWSPVRVGVAWKGVAVVSSRSGEEEEGWR